MSEHLQREIESLKKEILTVATLVEESLRHSVRAFLERDATLAKKVIDGDAKVKSTNENPNLCIDIKSLGSLFTGMRRARELSAWGLIEGADEAIAQVDRIFETRHAPHCPDHY